MQNDSLGDRIKKNYEDRYRIGLTRKTPVIIRVDGKAFHTLTRTLPKPFSEVFINDMAVAALETAKQIQGCKLAYVQSDEASFLLTDYDDLVTEAWFDYNLQKIVSVTASIMTIEFNKRFLGDYGRFDARAFNIPKEEVANYFLWRAKDWERNSLQMYARAFFSHKELHHMGHNQIHEMLHSIGKNWTTDLSDQLKNGTFLQKTEKGFMTRTNIQPDYQSIASLVEPYVWDKEDV